jgi:hypothetical protein
VRCKGSRRFCGSITKPRKRPIFLRRDFKKLTAEAENRKATGCKTNKDLPWQVVPANLAELFAGQDASKQTRAIAAMLQMKKIDMAGFERAAQESSSKVETTKGGSKPRPGIGP